MFFLGCVLSLSLSHSLTHSLSLILSHFGTCADALEGSILTAFSSDRSSSPRDITSRHEIGHISQKLEYDALPLPIKPAKAYLLFLVGNFPSLT